MKRVRRYLFSRAANSLRSPAKIPNRGNCQTINSAGCPFSLQTTANIWQTAGAIFARGRLRKFVAHQTTSFARVDRGALLEQKQDIFGTITVNIFKNIPKNSCSRKHGGGHRPASLSLEFSQRSAHGCRCSSSPCRNQRPLAA